MAQRPIYKEITYEEYKRKTKNMNYIELSFSPYRKELIIPDDVHGILNLLDYLKEHENSTNPNDYKYMKIIGYENYYVVSERVAKELEKDHEYMKILFPYIKCN